MLLSISVVTARRWLALTCLGAASFAAPMIASAQPIAAPTTQSATPEPMARPAPHAISMTHRAAYRMQRETLDQRISSMHAALMITPAQEADWTKVADVMRRNDSDMQKLIADRQARAPHELSAVTI